MTLQTIFAQEPGRFIEGGKKERGGVLQDTWYDVWANSEIKREDTYFNFFFTRRLRQLDISELPDFLTFYLLYAFKGNRDEYVKFLNLSIREYAEKVPLTQEIIDTVQDWIMESGSINPAAADDPADSLDEKVKGRLVREPGDRLTSLTLNQTALLIQLLQQNNVILKGEYLTYSHAGKAFGILTGYSANSLRQQLGAKGEVEGVKFEDYKEILTILQKMVEELKNKIPDKGN